MTTSKLQTGRGRGFASMTKEQRARIASLGGKKAHELGRAYEWTSEAAQRAGRKGGQVSRRRSRKVQHPDA